MTKIIQVDKNKTGSGSQPFLVGGTLYNKNKIEAYLKGLKELKITS